ncbi:MAG: hypothetical protein R3E69_07510 [Steroidobacteraceae bacterium]
MARPRRRSEPLRAHRLQPSRALLAAVIGWLVVAGGGILASQGLPWGGRIALLAGLLGCAWPAVRRDLALRSHTSIHRIAHRPPDDWYIELDGRAVPGVPSPHAMVLGGAVWLAFETDEGVRRACIVDRSLGAQLRLAYRANRGRLRRTARMHPDT